MTNHYYIDLNGKKEIKKKFCIKDIYIKREVLNKYEKHKPYYQYSIELKIIENSKPNLKYVIEKQTAKDSLNLLSYGYIDDNSTLFVQFGSLNEAYKVNMIICKSDDWNEQYQRADGPKGIFDLKEIWKLQRINSNTKVRTDNSPESKFSMDGIEHSYEEEKRSSGFWPSKENIQENKNPPMHRDFQKINDSKFSNQRMNPNAKKDILLEEKERKIKNQKQNDDIENRLLEKEKKDHKKFVELEKEIETIRKDLDTIKKNANEDHFRFFNITQKLEIQRSEYTFKHLAFMAAQRRMESNFREDILIIRKRVNDILNVLTKKKDDLVGVFINNFNVAIINKVEIRKEIFEEAFRYLKNHLKEKTEFLIRQGRPFNLDEAIDQIQTERDKTENKCVAWLDKYERNAFSNKEECLKAFDEFAKSELLPFVKQTLPDVETEFIKDETEDIANKLLRVMGIEEIEVRENAPFDKENYDKVNEVVNDTGPSNSVVRVSIKGYRSELSGRVIRKPKVVVRL
jgi:molecular chaperone GrpE (heat shock protein)